MARGHATPRRPFRVERVRKPFIKNASAIAVDTLSATAVVRTFFCIFLSVRSQSTWKPAFRHIAFTDSAYSARVFTPQPSLASTRGQQESTPSGSPPNSIIPLRSPYIDTLRTPSGSLTTRIPPSPTARTLRTHTHINTTTVARVNKRSTRGQPPPDPLFRTLSRPPPDPLRTPSGPPPDPS
eukprot:20023-Prorocentrum_minimum.AAC.1